MERILQKIYRKKQFIFRALLILVVSASIIYFFPKGVTFRYDFQKGKPWLYESLYAPFDFPIYKTKEDIEKESKQIANTTPLYFDYDASIKIQIKSEFKKQFEAFLPELKGLEKERLLEKGLQFIDTVYKNGIIATSNKVKQKNINLVFEGNRIKNINIEDIFLIKDIKSAVYNFFETNHDKQLYELFFKIITPNISENKNLTQKSIDEELKKIIPTRGNIDKGTRIILKGEIVEDDKYKFLESLRKELSSQTWNKGNQKWLLIGYALMILVAVTLLLLYIRRYHSAVYQDDNKLVFIFFNMITMIVMVSFVMRYGNDCVYAIPLSILPFTLNPFFGNRLAFITQIVTIFLLGFIIPNSFEFLFIQFVVALIITLTDLKIYQRSHLFISIGQIVLAYLVMFIAFNLIQEGSNFFEAFRWKTLLFFFINGLATLFVQPLIYIYEKTFSLVSDISLLELSDANSKLLRELSEKTPGTFQHSLQVSNLAEAAANKIGVATLLVRVGALYHDIGKMKNPLYFTENQTSVVSPHDDLTPQESTKIIINHVIEGIKIAKKHKLPDRVIDFIRTHHGTSLVKYFYALAKAPPPEVNAEDFMYPGPIPFSKETAILMMADAVEASSKSIKNPTQLTIDKFVDKIIAFQVNENQFANANITFKEIEEIKKVFKKKLSSIYNLRIAYPE